MRRLSPLAIHVIAPFTGTAVALSADPSDCCLILQRLAARKRREARKAIDRVTAEVILTEALRFDRLIELLQRDAPRRPSSGTRDA